MADNAQMIIDLDRKRMQAMAQKDVATLNDLIADDLIYTHSSARIDTKQSLVGNMQSGWTVYNAVEPSDVKAQDLGSAVVLTGIAQIHVTSGGKPNAFGVRFTDVYANRGGKWQWSRGSRRGWPTDAVDKGSIELRGKRMMQFNILVVPYMLSRGERVPLAGSDPARFQQLMHRVREQMQFAEQLGYSGFCMTEQHMQIEGMRRPPIRCSGTCLSHSTRRRCGLGSSG